MANGYNGWTNYATWRVNLEMIDGMQIEDITYGNRHYDLDNAYELGQAIKEWCESLIDDTSSEGLARDYALAFMADVNWVEIANHMIIEHCVDEEQPVPEDVWKNAING